MWQQATCSPQLPSPHTGFSRALGSKPTPLQTGQVSEARDVLALKSSLPSRVTIAIIQIRTHWDLINHLARTRGVPANW